MISCAMVVVAPICRWCGRAFNALGQILWRRVATTEGTKCLELSRMRYRMVVAVWYLRRNHIRPTHPRPNAPELEESKKAEHCAPNRCYRRVANLVDFEAAWRRVTRRAVARAFRVLWPFPAACNDAWKSGVVEDTLPNPKGCSTVRVEDGSLADRVCGHNLRCSSKSASL